MPFKEGESGNPNQAFKPGQSGNPAGRPKGKSITTILNELLEKVAGDKVKLSAAVIEFMEEDRPLTNAEALSMTLLYKALVQNDMKAITEIMDRTEGKSLQKTELTGKDGKDLLITGFQIAKPNDTGNNAN